MTSIRLAKKLKVQHFAVMRLIKKYTNYFDKLDKIEFKEADSGGGRPVTYVDLNKKHQDFVIVLLKNKGDAVKFKFDIVNKM